MQIKLVLQVCCPGSITGSAVVWHFCKAHVQSHWKRANRDPMASKSLKFSNLNLILFNRSTALQIFYFNSFNGAAPWNYVTVLGLSFLVGYAVGLSYVLLDTHPSRTMDRFSRFTADTTCFRPGIGDCDNIGIHLRGNIPPNSPKRGVNRQLQAKQAEYKNRDILQSVNMINVQF